MEYPPGNRGKGSPLGCFTKSKHRRFILKLSVGMELLNQNYYIICPFQMVRGKTLVLRTSCEFRNLFSNCLNYSHESERNHVFGLNAGKTLTNRRNEEMIFVCYTSLRVLNSYK